ncbi:MAG TPA: TonB-dependent receptor, partial [Candidatus Acidoferrales bacterium]|nr:TonB-dependent receptor [Candidatus Acidoferrales bacterium]
MNAGRLTTACVAFLTLSPLVLAQRSAYLYGRVVDPSDATVSEAMVTVVNEDTGFRRITQSQTDGEYVVSSLRPGIYKVTVRKDGFRTMIRFNVKLEVQQPARADFTLSVGAVQETITVEGTTPLLGQEDASIGIRVFRDEIQRLPLNGGGLLSLAELSPGTNVTPATRGEAGQFTANGQRPNANYFTVDGASANTGVTAGGLPAQANGGVLPAMSAFGSLDSLLPMEAVDEFRVQTSSEGPELGRLPGATISLASRSGTNDWHGSIAYRFRHELLAANDWFANNSGLGRGALRLQDVAPSLGGPIRRDHTFFFLSYQHMQLRGPYVWQQPVPSLATRQAAPDWLQPALNLFPLPNGVDFGNGLAAWNGRNIRPAQLDSGIVRIDHALTANTTLFARYNDSPSTNEFGSTEVNRLDLRFQSVTLGLSLRPAASLALDFRANESQAAAHSTWTGMGDTVPSGCELAPMISFLFPNSVSCDNLVRFSIGGVGQVVTGREGDRKQRQFQMLQSTIWNRGAHGLRFGADYRRITPVRRDATGVLSVIADDITTTDNRDVWKGQSPAINASTEVSETSLWVQDTWRVSKRLTVTPGLRWEFSPAPVPADNKTWFLDPSTNTLTPARQPLWPDSYTNFAPRLGAAWRITKDGRTVLRAGGGLFYDSSLSIATDLINSGPFSTTQFQSGRAGFVSSLLIYGFMPDLHLPRLLEWNVTLDHAIGANDVLSVGYVGSAGDRLIRREVGGAGSSPTFVAALTTNNGESNYQGLQAQYRRRVIGGFAALVSYSWSHSMDDDSSDAFLVWAGGGANARRDRASSDFDLRHSLSGALTYTFAGKRTGGARFLGGWSVDTVLRARSGFPISVLENDEYQGVGLANAVRPNLMPDQPVWLPDGGAPGGRRINPAAFYPAGPGIPGGAQGGVQGGVQGNLGRNSITGFGMSQADVAVRREFRLGEHRSLQVRMEA